MKIKIFTTFVSLVSAVLFLTGNASAGFAASEAGISAYVNVGTNISLSDASTAYKIIEDNTSTYIIGIVEVPGSTEYELPHVFTSSDGWVMAYYPKEHPRAKIMSLARYDRNNPDLSQISNTRLEDAISKVSSAIEIDYSTIKPNTKYYDFQYPEANRVTIIAETRNTYGMDSFMFRVPKEITLYNVSWEYYSYDSNIYYPYYGASGSRFKLNGLELIGTGGTLYSHNSSSDGGEELDERYYGIISSLRQDALHKGELWYETCAYNHEHARCPNHDNVEEGSSNVAIVLIYKVP